MKKTILAATIMMASGVTSADESAALKQEIEQLKLQMNALTEAVEQQADAGTASDVMLGGYGEMHLNLANGADNEIDYHRFVIFLGKEFSEKTRFFAEFELEHSLAGEGQPGEVELEQAYIEHDLNDRTFIKAGMFLVPVGLINETHEPNTFYGVERNNVEKNIIPSTWWEGGVALSGRLDNGFSYDLAMHSGLSTSDGSVRKGRQKVAEATANKAAYTARLKYTGVAGLELGAAVQRQDDVLQGSGAKEVNGTLIEGHVAYQNQGFGLRALYAEWHFDDGIEDLSKGEGATRQNGFYLEPSYRMGNVGVFYRVSRWDNQADANLGTDYQQQDVGFNYWLHDSVALKADYYRVNKDGDLNASGYNLGVGYSF